MRTNFVMPLLGNNCGIVSPFLDHYPHAGTVHDDTLDRSCNRCCGLATLLSARATPVRTGNALHARAHCSVILSFCTSKNELTLHRQHHGIRLGTLEKGN